MSLAEIKDPAMSGQLEYERVEGDFYATPPENVDCLLQFEDFTKHFIWEPACGEGHISKRLEELLGRAVLSTDLYDRGYGDEQIDFLSFTPANLPPGVTAIITNPPYGDLAEAFIRKALELMREVGGKVAMFLRNEYDCGKERRALFANYPFAHKIVVTKRPRWIEGSKGSPRHSYSWFVWDFSNDENQGAYISYVHPDDCKKKS